MHCVWRKYNGFKKSVFILSGSSEIRKINFAQWHYYFSNGWCPHLPSYLFRSVRTPTDKGKTLLAALLFVRLPINL